MFFLLYLCVIEYYRIHRDLNSILHIKIFYINYITINKIFFIIYHVYIIYKSQYEIQ